MRLAAKFVIYKNITTAAPFTPTDAAPETVQRFARILGALAGLIAARFLRRPDLLALIVPLWRWLNRAVRRLERAVARPVVARAPGAKRERTATAPAAGMRLPGGRGWLVRVLGYEAAAYASQLQQLLREPEMQALLAAMPGMARVLRPVCRMLLLEEVAAVALPVRVRVRPERAPKPKRERVRLPREPRSWWPLRMQKYGKT